MHCRPKGNILTRRLCRNRKYDDNELYRSNSFKFERFERSHEDNYSRTLGRQVRDIDLLFIFGSVQDVVILNCCLPLHLNKVLLLLLLFKLEQIKMLMVYK